MNNENDLYFVEFTKDELTLTFNIFDGLCKDVLKKWKQLVKDGEITEESSKQWIYLTVLSDLRDKLGEPIGLSEREDS